MKKLAVALFVALLGLAFTAPAFALENQFGGYWRVRMFNNTNFDGDDAVRTSEIQKADTRTRLYYTAVINDNLKFVNKFEMDATWGTGGTSYGDLGADGIAVEVKNSYVDFNLGAANVKIGTQGAALHRSFIFDNDFSGIVVGAGGFLGLYAKITEAGDGVGDDAQLYHAGYAMDMGAAKLNIGGTYVDLQSDEELYYIGLDLDGTAGPLGYWATFIYNGGEYMTRDVTGFLIAAGANFGMFHGQFFHATGEESATGDTDAFHVLGGTGSYYWAEIMGYGTFDDQVSNGSPADAISNITALNVGLSHKVNADLTVDFDIWYAMLAEDNAAGEDELGTELDLAATYQIVEGLSMKVVAAYLFAGDATNGTAADDANPFEVGTQFSISF